MKERRYFIVVISQICARILCGDNKDVLDEFLERMKNVLSNSNKCLP